MKKISIVISIIVFVAVFFLVKHFVSGSEIRNMRIDGNNFQVEVSKNDAQRYRGLSGRKNLCSSCGMIFEFPKPGNYSFTMRGMNFPLDMIWINNGKIVYIAKNVPTNRQIINPNAEADQVLELNAGSADKYGLKEGDEIAGF